MNLSIGVKIKELRKSQDITQEKLASYLNISYQAVSKWENGTAYPDITLLPAIANFFSVSTDELLGVAQDDSAPELKNAEKIYKTNRSEGKVGENIVLSRRILEKYPKNYVWMLNLATALTEYDATLEQIKIRNDNKYIEEAILLCERIKEDCTSDPVRNEATRILCLFYPEAGKIKEAFRLAEDSPGLSSCKELLLARIYSGEERIKRNQENLILLIDTGANILVRQAFDKECGKELSFSEKVYFVEAANKLYEVLAGDDENNLLVNQRLAWNFRRIAELKCADGKNDEALTMLLCAEKAAALYDKGIKNGSYKYNSLFLKRCEYETLNVPKNWEGTETSMLFYRTTEDVFASLKKDNRFLALQKRLKETMDSLNKEMPSAGKARN